MTASRSSLDNLDSHKDTNSEPNEAGYVETRNSERNGPPSPLYAVVEGPNSPKSPGVSPDGAPLKNKVKELRADYIEVLPDTGIESRDSTGVPPEGTPLKNELNDLPADYIEVLPDTGNESRDSET